MPFNAIEDDALSLGLMDAMERASEFLHDSNSSLDKMGEATEELGELIGEVAVSFQAVDRSSSNAVVKYRRLSERSATYLEGFAQRVVAETPVARTAFSRALDFYSAGLATAIDFDEAERRETLVESRKSLTSLSDSILAARKGSEELKNGIQSIPRLTSGLIKAKGTAVAAIDEILNMCQDQVGQIGIVIQQIDDLLS